MAFDRNKVTKQEFLAEFLRAYIRARFCESNFELEDPHDLLGCDNGIAGPSRHAYSMELNLIVKRRDGGDVQPIVDC